MRGQCPRKRSGRLTVNVNFDGGLVRLVVERSLPVVGRVVDALAERVELLVKLGRHSVPELERSRPLPCPRASAARLSARGADLRAGLTPHGPGGGKGKRKRVKCESCSVCVWGGRGQSFRPIDGTGGGCKRRSPQILARHARPRVYSSLHRRYLLYLNRPSTPSGRFLAFIPPETQPGFIADIFMRPYSYKMWAVPTPDMQCPSRTSTRRTFAGATGRLGRSDHQVL